MSTTVIDNLADLGETIVYEETNGVLVISKIDEKDKRDKKQKKYECYRRIGDSEKVFEKMGEISFQKGYPTLFGINGFTNEAVIAILIDRILQLNEIVPCEENVKALARLQEAKELLEGRQQRINATASK